MKQPTVVSIEGDQIYVSYKPRSQRVMLFGKDNDTTSVVLHFEQKDAIRIHKEIGEFLETHHE